MWILHPERRYTEPWKFLTYGVAHNDPRHLIVNLVGQVILGLGMEISHSSWMVAFIYFMGMVASFHDIVFVEKSINNPILCNRSLSIIILYCNFLLVSFALAMCLFMGIDTDLTFI